MLLALVGDDYKMANTEHSMVIHPVYEVVRVVLHHEHADKRAIAWRQRGLRAATAALQRAHPQRFAPRYIARFAGRLAAQTRLGDVDDSVVKIAANAVAHF